MKKNHQQPVRQTRTLQAQDLASVRGGDNGVLHMDAIVGGGKVIANENGVLHMQ